MKRIWILVVAGALLLVAVVAALTGHKTISAGGFIAASPNKVWQALMDTEAYGEWHPVLVEFAGPFEEGKSVSFKLKNEAGEISDMEAEVYELRANETLNQGGGIPLILTFDHRWILSEEEGGTRLVQREDFRGIGVWFWDPSWFETAYGDAIQNLRQRVE